MNLLPRLVIVGRPNVGKSTLFNRLLGRRRALVHDEPGVTRDRLEEKAEWWIRAERFPILLVDTGGLGGDRFAEEIARQVDTALSSADVVVVLFDGQAGLTPADQEVVRKLKQSGVTRELPVIGLVNKVDAETHETLLNEFFATGLDPILTISAEHNRGMDDLQAEIKKQLEQNPRWQAKLAEQKPGKETEPEVADESAPEEIEQENPDSEESLEMEAELEGEAEVAEIDDYRPPKVPRIAIVGRPNVGKSTLVNALTGEERMITSPIAGTTVDAVDSLVTLNDKPFVIIDTAGIRRKSKTEQGVEVLSVVQARKALERCDVAILLLDGELGTIDQDEKIGGLIEEVGCSVILVVNKWDTQAANPKFTKEMASKRIRGKMAYLNYAPMMFVSAKRRQGLDDLGDLIEEILHQRKLKVPTHEFTEFIRKESEIHNPMNAKFYLCHQSGRNPPTFVCHVSDPKKVHFSLKRHLVNALRERWGFMGSPVRLLFVEGKSRKGPVARKQYEAAQRARRSSPGEKKTS